VTKHLIFAAPRKNRYDSVSMWLSARRRSVVATLLAVALTGASGGGWAAVVPPRRGTPAAPAPRNGAPASPTAPAVPVEESASERRAVRGSPIDDPLTVESPELRELRRFEEQTFPRGGAPWPGSDATDGAPPPPPLRGHWGGTGDIPPELRSPEASQKTAPPPSAPDSDWLRSLKLPELPVRWDAQVLRYLDYFRNDPKGRAVMAAWLRRAGRYREIYERTLDRYGLPRDLIYVAMVESGFESAARSRAGAGGIWQFMPGAARAYGVEVSYWVDGRRDPERSADAAARYLKDLYVRFGSWYLVFAAYNAGYGAVLSSISRYNTNDFWELCRHESGLPWESSIYVPKILAAAIVGHNQDAFGFGDIVPDAPFAYERVDAAPGTTVTAIARAAGAKVEVIEALNPQLVRDRTPPDRGALAVRVPIGSAALYAGAIEGSRGAADRVDTVVLRFGETIDDVARGRGVAPRDLRRLNGVKDSAELRAGVTIVVPRRASAVAKADARPDAKPEGKADEAPAAGGEAAAADDEQTIVAVPDRVFSYDGRERVFYRTRDGDSIDEIAETFGVGADDLIEWNNLDPAAKLQPRLVLQVYVRKDFDPAGVMLLDSAKVRVVTLGSDEFLELEAARRGKKRLFYSARPGDTLAKVGRRYGLTPGDLARINRFSYNTELHEGQRIVVYSPTGDAPREVTMGLTPEPKRPPSALPRGSGPAGRGAGAGAAKGLSVPRVVATKSGAAPARGASSPASRPAADKPGPPRPLKKK
jgi:membrane-bound lytic murein transglycosylase D